MDALEEDAEIAERAMIEWDCRYPVPENIRTVRIFDRDRRHFLVMREGWNGYKRIHSIWAHIELRDGKFWIQEDGSEEGIANFLLEAGVSHDRIVLAFYYASVRQFSDFAVA